ncbi:MAG: hypothetical protein JSW11_05365 [Candidatus Heimdallarchaeota archaeon]|nr:MAG: hypothetical protein JSW11_05365 [Candidatus Heimdallarchaeota archaeon]
MLSNFVQDPESLLYENLFFFLTCGTYDSVLSADFMNYYYEEFFIICEQWKDRIEYLESIIPIQTQRFIRQEFSRNTSPVEFQLFFVIYTVEGRLLGLGVRIVTPDSDRSTAFALTPEDRLRKTMFLLSRGLLQSFHHRIIQIECPVPI